MMRARDALVARVLLAAILISGGIAEALAQSAPWPSRTVRIIVPYPPGGSPDIIARLIANDITGPIGQAVVVENRSGANGQIGTDAVVASAPDGHTLLLASDGPIIINPLLAGRSVAQGSGGVIPVSLIAETPFVLLAGPSVKETTLSSLIQFVRSNPGKLTFGSSGNGSQHHLAGELLKSVAGLDIRHVPYRGFGAAVQDVISSNVDLLFGSLPAALPFVKAGNLKPIAMAAAKRAAELSDVPTAGEQGLPALEVSAWFGIMAPRDTSSETVARIHAAVAKALTAGVTRERMTSQGMQVIGSGPAEYAARIQLDAKVWEDVIRKAGIKAQ